MCCRGWRCFRINCHCQCFRCRNCTECERIFGAGGIAETLAGGALESLATNIARRPYRMPPPLPPPPLEIGRPPSRSTQGNDMVVAVQDNCAVQ